MFTKPLESETRQLVDRSLKNLGYNAIGEGFKHIFTEQPRTEIERKKLKGKRPDYVIYSEQSDFPIIVIETKKKGNRIDDALEQGADYARVLEAPIVFATDGIFCKSLHSKFNKPLILNQQEVDEFIRESLALKFLREREINTISKEVLYGRDELIKVFSEANNMLRGEGLRAGIDRFSEFANILFLKLISESEEEKELIDGVKSKLLREWRWDYIKDLKPNSRIEYINKVILNKLNVLYGTEIFTPLQIRNPLTLKEIIDNLDPLKLNDMDSDVKGDAFEYFLEKSTSSGNDLGEYFTPRHIVKTMVRLANPQIGEKIYDPFCGTGGLLIESFRHIQKTMYSNVPNKRNLKEKTIYGNEITNTSRITKMNMILAGDGHSNISMKDSLAEPVDEKYDVVLTNMPYSQKTRYSRFYDIPSNNGDSICVQHCIRSINGSSENGRIVMVVPEGFLFRKDLAKTREYVLSKCNLRSIISLPQGVFLPYATAKTNIMYLDKVKNKDRKNVASKHYWYFEVKNDGYTLDNHRRKINGKTDFETYAEYRKLDKENEQEMIKAGFKAISFKDLIDNDFVLISNKYDEEKRNSTDDSESKICLSDIAEFIRGISFPKNAQKVTAESNDLKIITTKAAQEKSVDESSLISVSVKYLKNPNRLVKKDDILISLANSLSIVGRVTYIDKDFQNTSFGAFVGLIRCNKHKIFPRYLFHTLRSSQAKKYYLRTAKTTTNISNLTFEDLGKFKIPLPSMDIQKKISLKLDKIQDSIKSLEEQIKKLKIDYSESLECFLSNSSKAHNNHQ